MSLVIGLLYLLIVNFSFVVLFKRKFETTIIQATIFPVLTMYITGFFNNVKLGFYLPLLTLIPVFYVLFREKECLSKHIKNYFSVGFIIFVIIFVFVAFLQRERSFMKYDEFSHWGQMVINTIQFNKFYLSPESTLYIHKDYPPFFTLLEVLFCGFNKFIYTEANCYRATTFFSLACFLPVFSELSIKKLSDLFKPLIIVLIIILSGIMITPTTNSMDSINLYNSIYVDYPMAILIGYALFFIVKEHKKDNFFKYASLILIISSILLSKQVGLVFAIMCIFLELILQLVDKKLNIMDLFFSVPFILLFLWNRKVKALNIGSQFSIGRTFKSLFRGSGLTQSQLEIKRLYLDSLFNRLIVNKPFLLNYFSYVLMIVIILLIFSFIFKKGRELNIVTLIYLFGSAGYALLMGVMYMFSFNSTEGLMLASFNRYMTSYLYIGLYLFIVLILDSLIKIEKIYPLIIYLLVCVCFVDDKYLYEIDLKHSFKNNLSTHAEYINQFLLMPDDSNVLLIKQWSSVETNMDAWMYYCRVNDVRYSDIAKFDSYSFGSKEYADTKNLDLTPSELKEFIKNYDYIVTYVTDDYFYYDYWTKITDTEMYTDCIYSVDVDENGELVFGIVYDYNRK